jgi:hypothetical protein
MKAVIENNKFIIFKNKSLENGFDLDKIAEPFSNIFSIIYCPCCASCTPSIKVKSIKKI